MLCRNIPARSLTITGIAQQKTPADPVASTESRSTADPAQTSLHRCFLHNIVQAPDGET